MQVFSVAISEEELIGHEKLKGQSWATTIKPRAFTEIPLDILFPQIQSYFSSFISRTLVRSSGGRYYQLPRGHIVGFLKLVIWIISQSTDLQLLG